MTTGLPIEAERYLANLAEGLRAMPRNERDSLLLELRSHFEALAARGGAQAAVDGVAELGSAQGLAREFIAARRGGGAPIAVPEAAVPDPVKPFTARAAIAEAIATIRGADERLRVVGAVLLATLGSTNFMAFLAAHEAASAWPKPLTAALRLAGLLFALVAAYRIMLAGSPKPWRVDLPFARYVGGAAVMLAAIVAVQLVIKALVVGAALRAGLDPGTTTAMRAGAAALATIALVFALVRFQPWLVSLATARPGLTPLGSWRGMRGKTAAMIGGWLALVLPLFAVHYAITAYALAAAPTRFLLPLAGIDAIVATVQTFLVSALLVTAYRWVADRAAPEPAPFAALEPSRDAVDAARRRLLDALDERYEKQMRPFAAR